MRFLNPAGLWLLLGIPVLIIIYLIKSQHEQRAVSSTYIWKLSERFAQKRLP
ncbi:MAG: BatA domain-containing protein, partial [Clostridia bacterium]|nr:BatA domain-containing protein [Clostridia bacterium]